jgi:hypothetical protein
MFSANMADNFANIYLFCSFFPYMQSSVGLSNFLTMCREIEVKVMSYQDDLENGEKGIKAGWSIQDQVS